MPESAVRRVLFIATEAAPLAKVGGLADVAAALPPAMRDLDVRVDIALPLHTSIADSDRDIQPVIGVPEFARNGQVATFHQLHVEETGVHAWLIGNDHFFRRAHPYTDESGEQYVDTLERFAFFQLATLHLVAWLRATHAAFYDLLHVNDHQAALIPSYLQELKLGEACGRPATVLTVHNLGYQGIYPPGFHDTMDAAAFEFQTGLPAARFQAGSPLEFWHKLNCLKAGIETADEITTVSPTYAREIRDLDECAFGLRAVLHGRADRLTGIRNGVDTMVWNPSTDRLLEESGGATFSVARMDGKGACKRALFNRFGFPASRLHRPLFGVVSRLVYQKGVDLLAAAVPVLAGLDAYVVVLGSGPERHLLEHAVAAAPHHAALADRYDEALAHLIEGGSDFFLMPSRYEPCGLNQMYSQIYGTLPIVRLTGGLADTVFDADAEGSAASGTGFCFEPYNADAFVGAITRAMASQANTRRFSRLRHRAMTVDFSWSEPAASYRDVYESAGDRRRVASGAPGGRVYSFG